MIDCIFGYETFCFVKFGRSIVAHHFHSAAHGASALGSIEMLKLLSAHKGQLWLNSSGGESPIHEAALAKHNGEYCELVL